MGRRNHILVRRVGTVNYKLCACPSCFLRLKVDVLRFERTTTELAASRRFYIRIIRYKTLRNSCERVWKVAEDPISGDRYSYEQGRSEGGIGGGVANPPTFVELTYSENWVGHSENYNNNSIAKF